MSDAAAAIEAGWFPGSRVEALGGGHIHETYLVSRPEPGNRVGRYVLQRISRRVFRDPAGLVAQSARVSAFLNDLERGLVPELVHSRTRPAHVDAEGEVWRLWRYVEGTRTVATTRDPALAQAAGAAFGRFERLLERLPAPVLAPSIAGFFDLAAYLDELDTALTAKHRARHRAELARIDARRGLAGRFPAANRYVHGDSKLGNLLFAPDGPVVRCVLDLDTVMHGHWAWDFGDLARSLIAGSAGAAGEAGDAGAVGTDVFVAAARGFLGETGLLVTTTELVDAPRYVALMLAVRYLTDHLRGDAYFRVVAHGENLDRARRQLALVERLERDREILAAALEETPGVEPGSGPPVSPPG